MPRIFHPHGRPAWHTDRTLLTRLERVHALRRRRWTRCAIARALHVSERTITRDLDRLARIQTDAATRDLLHARRLLERAWPLPVPAAPRALPTPLGTLLDALGVPPPSPPRPDPVRNLSLSVPLPTTATHTRAHPHLEPHRSKETQKNPAGATRHANPAPTPRRPKLTISERARSAPPAPAPAPPSPPAPAPWSRPRPAPAPPRGRTP